MSSWNNLKANQANQSDGHAYNKTLLARLGFADEDRKNSLHDQACQFLAQPQLAQRLAETFLPDVVQKFEGHRLEGEWKLRSYDSDKYEWVELTLRSEGLHLQQTTTEYVVSKGKGEYKTTIGFIDVMLIFRIKECVISESGGEKRLGRNAYAIAVEVKAGKTLISEVIRQIALYREHIGAQVWLLATPWPVTEAEKTALNREKIKHVLLGDEFKKFVAKSEQSPDATSDAVF